MRISTVLCIYSLRYFHWQLNLYMILVLLIFFVPLYTSHQLVMTIRLCEFFCCSSVCCPISPWTMSVCLCVYVLCKLQIKAN